VELTDNFSGELIGTEDNLNARQVFCAAMKLQLFGFSLLYLFERETWKILLLRIVECTQGMV
jgi:hypothetical protein